MGDNNVAPMKAIEHSARRERRARERTGASSDTQRPRFRVLQAPVTHRLVCAQRPARSNRSATVADPHDCAESNPQ
jgi:hypothetical protein